MSYVLIYVIFVLLTPVYLIFRSQIYTNVELWVQFHFWTKTSWWVI